MKDPGWYVGGDFTADPLEPWLALYTATFANLSLNKLNSLFPKVLLANCRKLFLIEGIRWSTGEGSQRN